MSGLVEAVNGCVAKSCLVAQGRRKLKADGCEIDLSGIPTPNLIIGFDLSGSPLIVDDSEDDSEDKSRPDFLFVSDSNLNHEDKQTDPGLLAPIEMSSGKSKSADKIKRQLQAGVDWLKNQLPQARKPNLFPIYCGSIDKFVRRKLKGTKVTFRGKREVPRVLPSGQKLIQKLR